MVSVKQPNADEMAVNHLLTTITALRNEVRRLRDVEQKIQALPEQLKAQAFNYGYERNLINIATSFEVAAKAIEKHVLPLLDAEPTLEQEGA